MFWKRKKEKHQPVDDRFHVNPTISVALKEQIERLAFILDQPVNYLGVLLFDGGIHEREVIERLAKNFRYGLLAFENTLFFGNESNKPLNVVAPEPNERISIRFDSKGEQDVKTLADLLDIEYSKTVAITMSHAIRHRGIVEYLLRYHNRRMHFDEVVTEEMKNLMRFIDNRNPYRAEWNQYFLQFIEGPTRRPKKLIRPITPECIDTETYRWTLD